MFEFWLKNETKGINLLLPVTPEGYENSFAREIETVRATEKGDIYLLGKKKPQAINITGFFPENDYSFTRSGSFAASTAMDYVETLKSWMEAGDIIRIVVADEKGAKINAQCYIEAIDYSSAFADNRDIPFTLRLREYIPLTATTITGSASGSTANAARSDTAAKGAKATSYTVVKGDSLSKIARELYGDASKWKKIYEANKSVIGSNPNLIYPGQVYTIPQ